MAKTHHRRYCCFLLKLIGKVQQSHGGRCHSHQQTSHKLQLVTRMAIGTKLDTICKTEFGAVVFCALFPSVSSGVHSHKTTIRADE